MPAIALALPGLLKTLAWLATIMGMQTVPAIVSSKYETEKLKLQKGLAEEQGERDEKTKAETAAAIRKETIRQRKERQENERKVVEAARRVKEQASRESAHTGIAQLAQMIMASWQGAGTGGQGDTMGRQGNVMGGQGGGAPEGGAPAASPAGGGTNIDGLLEGLPPEVQQSMLRGAAAPPTSVAGAFRRYGGTTLDAAMGWGEGEVA